MADRELHLIDRDKAIEAIEQVAHTFGGTLPNGLINQCYAALEALPPAVVTDAQVSAARKVLFVKKGNESTVHWSDDKIREALIAAMGV